MQTDLPTVLIPGLSQTAAAFAGQIPAVWAYGGVMLANHTRADSMSELARHILRDAPPRFRLIGFSMGGYLSFEILRQAADRIAALALIDTSPLADTDEQIAARHAGGEFARARGLSALLEKHFPFAVHSSQHDNHALLAAMKVMAEQVGLAALERQNRAILARRDSRDLLPDISCPTLVISGDSDTICTVEGSKDMAAAIPGAQFVAIRDCGHNAIMERPQAVAKVLDAWLRCQSASKIDP